MASFVKPPAPLPKWFWFASLLGCTPGFKKSRCKKLLKVTMSRVKLLKGRREVQVRQLRRDVAQLLQLGQEESAESRLDRLWKEQSLLSAYTKTGEYCQLVKANLSNIAGQRECPRDLKESLASLCFAASCCADLPELKEIREIMVMKYGKDFLISSHELLPGSHVNKMFWDAFSTKEPSEVSKKALLTGILKEYNVVQPKKPKPPPSDGGSRKAASSDMSKNAVASVVSHKQQSRHEHGSNFDTCKQHPNFDAQEQEEKHHKFPKQIGPTACTPTYGGLDGEHTPLPCVEGDRETRMLGSQKKGREHIHGHVDMIEEGTNETELGSQDVLLRALSHDRPGKERKSKRQAYKENGRVNQAGQEDRHPSSNGRSIYEKSGPESTANETIYVFHSNVDKTEERTNETELDAHDMLLRTLSHDIMYGFHGIVDRIQEGTDETEPGSHDMLLRALSHDRPGKERKSKRQAHKGNGRVSQAGQEDLHPSSNGRSIYEKSGPEIIYGLHGYGQGSLPDESKIRSHLETLGKAANEKFRLRKEECGKESPSRDFDGHTSHREKKQLYEDFLVEPKQEVPNGQPRKQRYHDEALSKDFNSYRMQEARNDYHEEHYQLERDAHSRSNGKSRSEKVIQEFNKIQQEKELPHRDYNDVETKTKRYSRSNEKSRPERVTDEFCNMQPERSSHKRNHHVQVEAKSELYRRPNKESMLERVANEFGNQQPGNGSLPEYVGTPKVQKERKHSSKRSLNEKAEIQASLGDHPSAHISQKGRKKPVKKHHFEGTPQEVWIDYGGLSVPDKAADESHHLHKRADNHGYHLKDAAEQRDRNLRCMENHFVGAKAETCGDHTEARLNGSAREPYMEEEYLPEEYGIQAMQKHSRRARKHNSDHADSKSKVLNGSLILEHDSNHVNQTERAYFPQWHPQLDSKPKACKESERGLAAAEINNGSHGYGDKSLPQVHTDQHEDVEAKLKSCETDKCSPLPSRFTQPPQRPPPPVPPYRVKSLPNRQPLNSPPGLPQRSVTLEASHVRAIEEPHVHPKLPEYEDLVASFAALRNKPAKPPMY